MNQETLRHKTSFVLRDLEQALFDYVKQNDLAESQRGKKDLPVSIEDPKELMFIRDVFEAFFGSLESEFLDRGKELITQAHQSELWLIRNACYHVGRPFLPCYWYRVSAIATHPLLLELGIDRPLKAVESAENNTFEAVDSAWLEAYSSEIPNNLPAVADFDATDFIGRKKEKTRLLELLRNKRAATISIVAPGGTGKTAVTLHVLRMMATEIVSIDQLDAIVFCSLKQEELTVEGIRPVAEAITYEDAEIHEVLLEALGDVYDTSFSNFEAAVNALRNESLVLVLDNVEGLIHQGEESLRSMEESLPENWKVLLTSRIPYEGSTVITMGPMRKGDATHLARIYAREKGLSLDETHVEELSERCSYNPLAIKLAIDTLMAGGNFSDSINASQASIAEYSFKKLIEALTDLDICILELTQADVIPSKQEMVEILSVSEDEVVTSLRKLKSTSLLQNHTLSNGENQWKVNESLRLFISTNQRNVQIRGEIIDVLRRRRLRTTEIEAANKNQNLPVWSSSFIPSHLPPGLQVLLSEIPRELDKLAEGPKNRKSSLTERISGIYKKLAEVRPLFHSHAEYWVAFARVANFLGLSEARQHFEQAVAVDNQSLVTRLSFLRYLHAQKYLSEAAELALDSLELLSMCAASDANSEGLRNTLTVELLAIKQEQRDFEFLFDYTKPWKEETGNYRSILGTFRAGSLKRQSEDHHQSPHLAFPLLIRAAKIIQQVVDWNDLRKPQAKECILIAREFGRHHWWTFSSDETNQQAQELLNFCERVMEDSILELGEHPFKKFDYSGIIQNLAAMKVDGSNPFHSLRWAQYSKPRISIGIDFDEAQTEGSIMKVTNIPRPHDNGFRKDFLFLKDEDGETFFLHKEAMKLKDELAWSSLQLDYPVVVYECDVASREQDKAVRVTVANFVRT